MPLTKQVIEEVVARVVKTEISGLKTDVSELKSGVSGLKTDASELKSGVSGLKTDISEIKTDLGTLHEKVDGLSTSVSDLAGMVQKFDQEQTFLSNRQSRHNDRIEKIEKKVFGAIQRT